MTKRKKKDADVTSADELDTSAIDPQAEVDETELDAEALAADPDEDIAATSDLDEAAKEEANEEAEAETRRSRTPVKVDVSGNPRWWAPVMVGLMVLGLVWLVVYYLSNFAWPVKSWGMGNMAVGFVLIMAGFVMTTRWK